MAKVIITIALREEMFRKFKGQAEGYFLQFRSLEEHPQKGRSLGTVGGVVIKELKCDRFRFYFITDGHVLRFGSPEELAGLLIKFVRMSDKKTQQKTIDEIKNIIKSMGLEGF